MLNNCTIPYSLSKTSKVTFDTAIIQIITLGQRLLPPSRASRLTICDEPALAVGRAPSWP